MTSDLGPKPDPQIEPKEPNPGGVDAVEPEEGPPAVNELPPEGNPAIEDVVPDEITETEDTETEATSDGASEPQKESPA